MNATSLDSAAKCVTTPKANSSAPVCQATIWSPTEEHAKLTVSEESQHVTAC